MALYRFPKSEEQILIKAQYHIFFKKDGEFDNHFTQNSLTNATGGLDIEHYRTKQNYDLSTPRGYVIHQFLADNNILSPYFYSLDRGMMNVAIEKLDGYVVDKLIDTSNLSPNKYITKCL